jgi:hypothetical protein
MPVGDCPPARNDSIIPCAFSVVVAALISLPLTWPILKQVFG